MEKKAAGQRPSRWGFAQPPARPSPPRSPGRPSPLRPRRRYLRCCGGSAAPGGPSSFRPGPRAVPPIPQLGTPLWGGAAVGEAGGRAGGVHLRRGGCLPGRYAAPGTLVWTRTLRVRSLRTGPGREEREEQLGREAGGGAARSPSNRGTPRETPLRKYAVTHGGGAERPQPRDAPPGSACGETSGGREREDAFRAAEVLWRQSEGWGPGLWREKGPDGAFVK